MTPRYRKIGLPPQLLELELAGRVARLPGGLYQRLGTA